MAKVGHELIHYYLRASYWLSKFLNKVKRLGLSYDIEMTTVAVKQGNNDNECLGKSTACTSCKTTIIFGLCQPAVHGI
ncbi:hypothetical protein ENHYD8BJ_140163 [Enhydrobacter sp. 8BJ]|nr:hypothetical protein ENHYD8BJ_140163 [Enhydrobacter sp. 8BJ]